MLALALCAGAAGCFDPTYPIGIPCSDAGTCPPGEVCDPIDFVCRARLGAATSADARPLADANLDALPPPDARHDDAAGPVDGGPDLAHACTTGTSGCPCKTHLDCAVTFACVNGACSTDCGTLGKLCCNGRNACNVSLVCDGTNCIQCGDTGQVCCPPNDGCNSGCCMLGTCRDNTAPTTCGPLSGHCIDCTYIGVGHACIAEKCACGSSADCSMSQMCNVSTAICSCLADGDSCAADPTACCNGDCMNFGNDISACGCIADGTECSTDGDCCSHRCVLGVCGRLASCMGQSATCQSNIDCCAGLCSTGQCTCVASGQAGCVADAQCCSGSCVNLACK
jgi:hypothetical protein